jgi:hypothetical protein
MFDAGKVIGGLVVFVGVATFPLWYNGASGAVDTPPELEYPVGFTSCVADSAYMRSHHMDLLNRWRDSVVREGRHLYEVSLQNTCMDCHRNKAAFCDRCHNYMAVSPYCWDCHVEPKGSM